jgi:IS5 family transposase
MLVEHYPLDKRFEELARHFPAMDRELMKIDQYLEDEQLYRWIKADLSKRYPKTQETGRNSTPVEVVLRMLVVKRLYGYSYEETVARAICEGVVSSKCANIILRVSGPLLNFEHCDK